MDQRKEHRINLAGWWRPVGALALYAALMHAHAWIVGVPAIAG